MRLQPVIGLETHVQLKTKSKLFSGASNFSDNAAPNALISAIDVGHPGTLPVPNRQAVEWAVQLGLALNGTIAPVSKFDRKHYFYPDLAKAYQISQFDLPIMQHGSLTIHPFGEEAPVTIGIERLHLEEDAAKNIHGEDGKSYVDYNRAGTPLCEIVTKPDFRTAAQAKAYLQEMRLLVRTLDVSDGDMEKGQMRCDVNISLREVDENGNPIDGKLHPKTEIKNVNSFKAVERAIQYEIQRQTKLWEKGEIPQITTTRGWNDTKQCTELQREKEDSGDYRYFPEPDIPPMDLRELTEVMRRTMPELPQAKLARLVAEYGFKTDDAKQMLEEPALADYAEQAMGELYAWLDAEPDLDEDAHAQGKAKIAKLVSGWLLSKLLGLMMERKIAVQTLKITPENFSEFITLLMKGAITGPNGLKILEKMLDDGIDPSHAVEELGAKRIDDADALSSIVQTVIESNPQEVERFKAGDEKLMQFFVGQIMKETRGNADPGLAARAIKDALR